MGGTGKDAFIIPLADIDILPKALMTLETYDGTGLEKLVEIIDDIVPKAGKGWYRMYTTRDKNEGALESQGERDGRSFLGKGKLFTPGAESALLGLMGALNNIACLVMQKTIDGQHMLYGTNDLPCDITSSWSISSTSGETRGANFMFEAPMAMPMVYKGTIQEYTPAP